MQAVSESGEDLVTRLRKRAEIRRQITTRKSVQEGKPDRLADLLDEAADTIVKLATAYLNTVPTTVIEGVYEDMKKRQVWGRCAQ